MNDYGVSTIKIKVYNYRDNYKPTNLHIRESKKLSLTILTNWSSLKRGQNSLTFVEVFSLDANLMKLFFIADKVLTNKFYGLFIILMSMLYKLK